MYADSVTNSMEAAITETNRRRAIQEAYNEEHGITSESVHTAVKALLEITDRVSDGLPGELTDDEKQQLIRELEDRMLAAAGELDFEKAAKLRDELFALRGDKPADKPQQTRRRNKHR